MTVLRGVRRGGGGTGVPPGIVVLLAAAVDGALGDPPNRWHPVAWLGHGLARVRRRWERGSPARLFVSGAGLTLAAGVVAGLVGSGLTRIARRSRWAGVIVEVFALKLVFSLRDLIAASTAVRRDLEAGRLIAARRAVGYHLVSRDTAELDEPRVASAAIESLAENLTDSVVAPIVYYLAFGLPGAFVYRAINTTDSMFGYRIGPLEHFGKVAARGDDLLNLVPARLAASSIVVAAGLRGESARGAASILWRDRTRTESPNAGWTMSAMAGALRITLDKPGAYRLGTGPLPAPRDIERAASVLRLAATTLETLLAAWSFMRVIGYFGDSGSRSG